MHFVRRMLKKRNQTSLPSTGFKSVIAMFEDSITDLLFTYGFVLCKRKENIPCVCVCTINTVGRNVIMTVSESVGPKTTRYLNGY